MNTVLVDKETLQNLISYVAEAEARDYEECLAMEWSENELKNHVYALAMEIQDSINAQ
jgi:hypothetical protein